MRERPNFPFSPRSGEKVAEGRMRGHFACTAASGVLGKSRASSLNQYDSCL
jgi:hypothetical protein